MLSIQQEVNEDARKEHLDSLKLLKQEAWDKYEKQPDISPTKVQWANVIIKNEETLAKVDGSMVQKISMDGHMQISHQATVLLGVLVRHVGEEVAEAILLDFKQEIEAISNE